MTETFFVTARRAILTIALLLTPFAQAAEPLVQIGAIPLPGVEGRLDHLTYDPHSQRLFVAGLENHTVEVVDLKQRRRVHELTGISEPQGLCCVPEKNLLLICSRGDGTCRSFDAKTFAPGPWIDVGRNADNIRFDAGAKVIYIGSAGEPGNGLLSAIDLVSLLPVSEGGQPAPPHSPADFLLDRPRQADPKMEFNLPAHPESFQLDGSNQQIFVNVPDEHEIELLHIGTNGFTKTASWPVTVGEKNFPMAFDAASHRLFIACRKPAQLAVYDSTNGKLLSQTECVGDADDLFYDEKSRRAYVVGGEGFVDFFQVSDDAAQAPQLIAHIPTAPRARTGLLIPELQILVVGAPNTGHGDAAVLLFQVKP
jgi:hypothetical protein